MDRKYLLILFSLLFLGIVLVACISTGVTEDEKILLITIEDLAEQGIAVGTPTEEGVNFVARRYINGTTEVEYEYDSEKDPANTAVIVFYSEADTLREEELAIKAFDDAVEAYLLGATFNNDSIEVVETPNAFLLGEENYSALIKANGNNSGTLVVTRKGRLVYSFILIGTYVKYQQTLEDLIGSRLGLFNDTGKFG